MPPFAVARARALAVQKIRRFLETLDYIDVEPPGLVPACGLEIHIRALEVALTSAPNELPGGRLDGLAYLHTSPEFAMKKLLASGYDRIYSLGKVWRAGEVSARHNHEFTLLEWYRAGFSAAQLMDETEALVKTVLDRPERFARLRVADLFRTQAGIDFDALPIGDANAFALAATNAGVRVPEAEAWDDIFERVFLEKITLPGAVFIHDYPVELAVLARRSPSTPRYAERFELFVDGLELCNGFAELTDPFEQRERFIAEQAERRRRGLAVYPLDEDFLAALATLPEAAGNAIGVDRLIMLALGAKSIDEIMTFAAPRLFRNAST